MDASLPTNPVIKPRRSLTTTRILQTVVSIAIILATIFTGFPPDVLTTDWGGRLNTMLTPVVEANNTGSGAQALRLGIVSGHWGNDSGAVCPDGTTEAQVNLDIASLVQKKLTALGYDVNLLQEFDPRLAGYNAPLLISIHADSCIYVNEQATGFKVAVSGYSRDKQLASRLAACLTTRYAELTGMPYHPGSVTVDMQDYYAFREINPATNAVIIETGFLNKDFTILTKNPALVADGIVAGIQCYLLNENISVTPTPASP